MKKSGMGAAIFSHLSFFLLMNLVFNTTICAQQPFYQGKSVRLIAGTTAGTVTDLWPRLIAEHMGKHISGNPGVVVQNMPGAGGVIAANYVYNVAKPDGLTLGTVSPSIYVDQIVGRKEVQFDWGKFNWIGTPEQYDYVFIMRADSPYKSIDDIRKPQNHPSAALRGRARISTKYLNSWKRLWARNF
jgi:tripartite-type tricarboxylate transporter receptor subunit TctC